MHSNTLPPVSPTPECPQQATRGRPAGAAPAPSPGTPPAATAALGGGLQRPEKRLPLHLPSFPTPPPPLLHCLASPRAPPASWPASGPDPPLGGQICHPPHRIYVVSLELSSPTPDVHRRGHQQGVEGLGGARAGSANPFTGSTSCRPSCPPPSQISVRFAGRWGTRRAGSCAPGQGRPLAAGAVGGFPLPTAASPLSLLDVAHRSCCSPLPVRHRWPRRVARGAFNQRPPGHGQLPPASCGIP